MVRASPLTCGIPQAGAEKIFYELKIICGFALISQVDAAHPKKFIRHIVQ
jgi:hypothetical protein